MNWVKHQEDACTTGIIQPMNLTCLRRAASLLLLLFSLAALAWGLWPLPTQTRSLDFTSADLGLPPGGPAWRATLTWPSRLRVGDERMIHLQIAGLESAPAVEPGGEAAAHLAARLELAGLSFSPQGEVSQLAQPGKPLVFAWRVQAGHRGAFAVTVWLHRIDSTGREVLSAQRLELRSTSLWGVNGPWVRALGLAGVLIGAAFGLDGLALAASRQSAGRRSRNQ